MGKELPPRNKKGQTFEAWLKSGLVSVPEGFADWPTAQMHWKRGGPVDLAINEYRDTNAYRQALKQKGKVLMAGILRRG